MKNFTYFSNVRNFVSFAILLFLISLNCFSDQKAKRILLVSPELSELFFLGGLGHAVQGLGRQLLNEGYQVDVFVPYMSKMDAQKLSFEEKSIQIQVGDQAFHYQVYSGVMPESALKVYAFKHQEEGQDFFDNKNSNAYVQKPGEQEAIAFGTLGKAQAEFIRAQNLQYDIVIGNDWTAGVLFSELKKLHSQGLIHSKLITAIHNLLFQGSFSLSWLKKFGLDEHQNAFEFSQKTNFLKGMINVSDFVYTVSPQYSAETLTPRFGAMLQDVLKVVHGQFRYAGIPNGIDYNQWLPTVGDDAFVSETFSKEDFSGKQKGKILLQKYFGFSVDSSAPVIVLTSRLAHQKGFDYLIPALEQIMLKHHKVQFVILGDGEEKYAQSLSALEQQYPDRFRYRSFDKKLERFVTTYGDFFMNASWFEPSGLNQFFAMLNGTVPIVSDVGGLSGAVQEGLTGFKFKIHTTADGWTHDDNTKASILDSFDKAISLWENFPAQIHQMRIRAMTVDSSWKSRMPEFSALFEYVLNDKWKDLVADKKISEAMTQSDRGFFPSQLMAHAVDLENKALNPFQADFTGGRGCEGFMARRIVR